MRATDAEKFKAIASAATQMTQLTEDLLLLARTEKLAQLPTRRFREDPGQLSSAECTRTQEKRINLKVVCLTGDLYLGEPAHLSRLFLTIENALQYTSEGGTVEIQASSEDHYLQVNVQDTGIGIAPEHLRHVFDRFWRADQSRPIGLEALD